MNETEIRKRVQRTLQANTNVFWKMNSQQTLELRNDIVDALTAEPTPVIDESARSYEIQLERNHLTDKPHWVAKVFRLTPRRFFVGRIHGEPLSTRSAVLVAAKIYVNDLNSPNTVYVNSRGEGVA